MSWGCSSRMIAHLGANRRKWWSPSTPGELIAESLDFDLERRPASAGTRNRVYVGPPLRPSKRPTNTRIIAGLPALVKALALEPGYQS